MKERKFKRRIYVRRTYLSSRRGFTLVEMIVSVAILTVLMLLVAQMIGATSKIWKNTSSKIEAFQNARAGFELMTDELRQATLNTYFDYFNAAGQTTAQWNSTSPTAPYAPAAYGRQSELHFISGLYNVTSTGTLTSNQILDKTALPPNGQITQAVFFQCPVDYTQNSTYSSLNHLLNAVGFFVEFGPDVNANLSSYVANGPPTGVLAGYQPVYRFRLMQFIQPTESLAVYYYSLPSTDANYDASPNDWFVKPISSSHATNVRIVADNIIALFIWPKKTDTATDLLAPYYSYDSRLGSVSTASPWKPSIGNQPTQMNQLPPIVRVAMVAIDEPSAKALQNSNTAPSQPPAQILTALAAKNPNTSDSSMFTNPLNMDADLAYLQTLLAAVTPHLNFRVYDTTIAMRSSKFSN